MQFIRHLTVAFATANIHSLSLCPGERAEEGGGRTEEEEEGEEVSHHRSPEKDRARKLKPIVPELLPLSRGGFGRRFWGWEAMDKNSRSGSKFPLNHREVVGASLVLLGFAMGLLGVYLTMPASDYSFLKLPRTLDDLQILRYVPSLISMHGR